MRGVDRGELPGVAMMEKRGQQVSSPIQCIVHFKKKVSSVGFSQLNKAVSNLKHPSILGGNGSSGELARYSYWGCEPIEVFEFKAGEDDPFGKLEKVLDKYRFGGGGEELGSGVFKGGWIGYFGYELGGYIEKVGQAGSEDIGLPLIRLSFYDKVIAYDHVEGCYYLIAVEVEGDGDTIESKLGVLAGIFEIATNVEEVTFERGDVEGVDFAKIKCNMSKEYYLESIAKIKRYIVDGDVYQVNFSQRFEADFEKEAVELFGWQNEYNASGYSAFIGGDGFSIVSASPELFVRICDGVISTRPIKGTRPFVVGEDAANRRNYEELLSSEKEKAELDMIIDLERNDLARICEAGSRRVVQGREIEQWASVYHAAATVSGRVKDGLGFCGCLKGIFPGGSITGAPKIASMEIINELEPTARGVYTGSIGFLSVDGSVCLNIAIRTIIIAGGKAYVQAGGGIVADSESLAEYEETLTKARALLAGIAAVNRKMCSSSARNK